MMLLENQALDEAAINIYVCEDAVTKEAAPFRYGDPYCKVLPRTSLYVARGNAVFCIKIWIGILVNRNSVAHKFDLHAWRVRTYRHCLRENDESGTACPVCVRREPA